MSEDLLSRPDSRRPGGFQVAINHQDGKGFQFPALRKNSTGPPFHAAFSKATNSIFVAARRWAFSSR